MLAAAIVDTDTKITGNELTFANGTLTSKITDNAGGVYTDSVGGIASQSWVNERLEGIAGTDTVTTVADDGKGYVGVTDAMDADGNHNYTVAFDEGKLNQYY